MLTATKMLMSRTFSGLPLGSFVTRDPSNGWLMYQGQRYRFGGANDFQDIGMASTDDGNGYGGTVVGTSYWATHSQIDAALDSMQNGTNARVIRPYAGAVGSVNNTLAVQPTLGAFNASALENVDYFLQQCGIRGIKVILTLSDEYTSKLWYVSQTGGGTQNLFYTRTAAIDAFKTHISYVLNHQNQYTGVAYKNDPTILAFETGNELTGNGGNTDAELASWLDTISTHIKVIEGAQQLVIDGSLGTTGDWVTYRDLSYAVANCDIYSQHAYDQYRTPGNLVLEAAHAHSYGKAFIIGEFSWNDKMVNGTALPYYLPWMLAYIENSPYIDGDLYFQMLAPLTHWNDTFTIHYPPYQDTNGMSVAELKTRTMQLSDHAVRMAGITPRIFINEDFTGTNGAELSTRVGPLGGAWAKQGGWVGDVLIQNNAAYAAATQARYYASGIPGGSNYEVTANIKVVSNAGYAGILLRAYSENNQGYVVYLWNNAGSITVSCDYEGSGGSLGALGGLTTPTVGNTYPLKVIVEGAPDSTVSVITVYWNNTKVLGPMIENNVPLAGRVGILSLNNTSVAGYHIDSLIATDSIPNVVQNPVPSLILPNHRRSRLNYGALQQV